MATKKQQAAADQAAAEQQQQAKEVAIGDRVHVRLNGRLGDVIGLSENPRHVGADEPVYRVRMADDSSIVESGSSALGDPSELETPEEDAGEGAEEESSADSASGAGKDSSGVATEDEHPELGPGGFVSEPPAEVVTEDKPAE